MAEIKRTLKIWYKKPATIVIELSPIKRVETINILKEIQERLNRKIHNLEKGRRNQIMFKRTLIGQTGWFFIACCLVAFIYAMTQ